MRDTIDRATFDELKATAGTDFVHDLVDTFLTEAPVMLNDLRAAFASSDADRFRRIAHSLKSNSNTFGALTLGRLARELELSGLQTVQATGSDALDALDAEYARVAQAMAELKRA